MREQYVPDIRSPRYCSLLALVVVIGCSTICTGIAIELLAYSPDDAVGPVDVVRSVDAGVPVACVIPEDGSFSPLDGISLLKDSVAGYLSLRLWFSVRGYFSAAVVLQMVYIRGS